ncbi:hypothetical protein A2533_02290 [Candidatus Falkowbacteria bacterium RIFOXYD2_FULL_35_9]|uniref:Uncharacterized protein n=1 Tax=Candidatus Falkowbacteria bacterium RIFOXYC2_FULL_36_12 TaxID=1798002 RepID=A0A1F5SZX0_9BACT|nr:MAG: hypothetical protein A2478_02750 [Candidatus Falkowbacteria bacterium RIFOXYC2_FULL_36_12]OGF33215.1 MAG: hypothetical protein A2223_01400 [Candidatus Falkowbacteria bacterium RIFOXYA2_FULL_35_8]OGF48334.1 MAG: hypothetical protein A2533_02290 [Candidatus Falkowbacteria bacterium RIFOXYD2_FULL_35_9]
MKINWKIYLFGLIFEMINRSIAGKAEEMRVLLISPNILGVRGGINRIQPPLGLGYVASFARQAGHEVFVRDTALEGYGNQIELDNGLIRIGETDDQIRAFIRKINPDVVGITATLSNLEVAALEVARLTKEVNPQIVTVLGGNHISFSDKDYDVDYVVKGEGEIAFVKLLEELGKGNNPNKVIVGIAFENLNHLPSPARDLMNMEAYFRINLFHSSRSDKRILNVMTSRGCPHSCSFCTSPQMWGRRVRFRDASNVMAEIVEAIEKYGIEEVQFEDDTLTVNYQRLMELCDLLRPPHNIQWCVPNGIRINCHSSKQDQMFKRMKESGCYQVTLACESGCQRVLDQILNKNLKLAEIKPAIRKAHDAGLLVHTFWLVGSPGETKSEMEQTIAFAQSCGADSYSVSILCPLPGTRVNDEVEQKNLWWTGIDLKQMIYRKSLFKVDGFSCAEDFEAWAEEQNRVLNQGDKIEVKQT